MYGSGLAEPSTTSSLGSETLIGLAGWNEGEPFWNGYSVRITKRFREMLNCLPEDILRFWIGHADKSITDRYSKMSKRIQTRKEWAEKAGLGFNLPAFCTQCTKEAAFSIHENAA